MRFLIPLLFILSACGLATTRPKVEMSLAQAALIGAKEAGADTKSPTLYRQAEVLYLKAKSAYRRKYFNKAKQYANASKKISEKAEYEAERKKALGDGAQ